ncbi:MAG: hypothetical protein IKD37_06845 [Clostridia bacterium]|nr:hypothetical protein [Clostridia bacterium]
MKKKIEIRYVEPEDYFPKELREKYWGHAEQAEESPAEKCPSTEKPKSQPHQRTDSASCKPVQPDIDKENQG